MSVEIHHYRQRSCSYDITITDANGDAVVIATDDKVRVKIWNEHGATPLLDLVSTTPSSGGSRVTRANPARLTITQLDALWPPGVYTIEISVVDFSDQRIKHVDSGVFVLYQTPGGGIT